MQTSLALSSNRVDVEAQDATSMWGDGHTLAANPRHFPPTTADDPSVYRSSTSVGFEEGNGSLPSEKPLRKVGPPILFLPGRPSSVVRAKAEKAWEGVVTERKQDRIIARLTDLLGTDVEQMVEIPLEDISDDDFPLVVEGAYFYWYICYQESVSRIRTRTSTIRFRRLPAWTKKEIDAARKKAGELMNFFGKDDARLSAENE